MVAHKRRVHRSRRDCADSCVPVRLRSRDGAAFARQRCFHEAPGAVRGGEVEQAVNAAFVEGQNGCFVRPRFANEVAVRVVRFRRFANEAQEISGGGVCTRVVAGHGIQAEAAHAMRLPERDDFGELRPQRFAVKVEIRHVTAELPFIPPRTAADFVPRVPFLRVENVPVGRFARAGEEFVVARREKPRMRT